MSQRNNTNIQALCIMDTTNVPPANPVEDSPYDRHQTSATGIHMTPLIRRQEEIPHLDPVCSHVYNLQKGITSGVIKDNIISTIPNCPKNGTHSHSNMRFCDLVNSIQPSTKQISHISWWRNIKSEMYHSPNRFGKRARNEQMLHRFL